MNKKNKFYIGVGIGIIIIILIIIIDLIKDIKSSTSEKQNNYTIENQHETGNVQYNPEQLNNLKIKIENIPQEVIERIDDEKKLINSIKEYVFFRGLVDANIAKCDNYRINEEDKQIKLRFVLDNSDKDTLLVLIDLSNNKINITDY